MKHLFPPAIALIVASAFAPQSLSAQIINIDFLAQRGSESVAPNYVGAGAAGGGTTFNGLAADNSASTDNINVSGSNLLDSNGSPTSVGFSITSVGADNQGTTEYGPLNGAYLFVNSANNTALSAAFTISGLGSATTENLFFTTSNVSGLNVPALTFTTGNGTQVTYSGSAPFNSFNTYEFKNVPVVGGQILGTFGTPNPSAPILFDALTIESVEAAPEPSTWAMMLGGLVFLGVCLRRKRGQTNF